MVKVIQLTSSDRIRGSAKRLIRSLEQAKKTSNLEPAQLLLESLIGIFTEYSKSTLVMDKTIQDQFDDAMRAYEGAIFAVLSRFCTKLHAYQFIDIFTKNLTRRVSSDEFKNND